MDHADERFAEKKLLRKPLRAKSVVGKKQKKLKRKFPRERNLVEKFLREVDEKFAGNLAQKKRDVRRAVVNKPLSHLAKP